MDRDDNMEDALEREQMAERERNELREAIKELKERET
jgi:hypothetical protein